MEDNHLTAQPDEGLAGLCERRSRAVLAKESVEDAMIALIDLKSAIEKDQERHDRYWKNRTGKKAREWRGEK